MVGDVIQNDSGPPQGLPGRVAAVLMRRIVVSVAQEGCVMWNGLPQQYERMSQEDQRTFDSWMRANAIFGAVLALGILAMAVAGFNAPEPDAAMSASAKASHVLAAD